MNDDRGLELSIFSCCVFMIATPIIVFFLYDNPMMMWSVFVVLFIIYIIILTIGWAIDGGSCDEGNYPRW